MRRVRQRIRLPSLRLLHVVALLLLVTVGCSSDAERWAGIYRSAQGRLADGEPALALSASQEGQRQARARGNGQWVRRFEVLGAEALVSQESYREALSLLEGDCPPLDDNGRTCARALMTRAFARCRIGQGAAGRATAEADFLAAARLVDATDSPQLGGEIALRHGNCAIFQNDSALAERSLRSALDTARKNRLRVLEGNAAGSLGLLRLRTGHIDDARQWLESALTIADANGAMAVASLTRGNLAWCHYLLGEYERALSLFRQVEDFTRAHGFRGPLRTTLTNLGNTYYRLGDRANARRYWQQALAVSRGLGERSAIAQSLGSLGILALEEGHNAVAGHHFEEALKIEEEIGDLVEKQESRYWLGRTLANRADPARAAALYQDVLRSPQASEGILWETHVALGELHLKRRRTAEAESEFARAFALMERSRARLSMAEHRISFFSSLARFYDGYVDLLISQGKTPHALDLADRSRARHLREKLNLDAGTKAAVPGQYEQAAKRLDATFLFYSLAPKGSYLWFVTPRQITLHRLPPEKEITERVERYQSIILRSGDPLAEEGADGQWLYEALVGPVARSIAPGARVVIVPDGALHQINFETLVVPSPAPHFWIEDATLATAPSLGLLEATNSQRATPRAEKPPILLVGDPIASGSEFPSLPYAGREMDRIAEQFDPARTTRFAGTQAVPNVYRDSKPERFAYIHFAAHAKPSSESPLDSAIVLSPKGDAFKLYAREVVNIPVQADLVTLSACYGAGARNYSGEGFVGLAWAFISSGAKNVIAALWNVEDASTAELMEDLYRNLRNGEPPPEALRAAKLNLIHSQTAHRKPYYWAPFVTYTRKWRSERVPRRRLVQSALR
jgi:CHAT domain-containing protein